MLVPALALAASVLVAAPSAAPAGAFTCERHGGRPWHAWRSRHFDVDTDVGDGEAKALVAQLEAIFALEVRAIAGGDAEIPGRILVVGFGDPAQYRALIGPDATGSAWAQGPLGEPTLLLSLARPAAVESGAAAIAAHLSWYVFPRQAPWFHAGLALFVQTAGVARDGAPGADPDGSVRRDVGAPAPAVLDGLRRAGLFPARDLLTWDGSESAGERPFVTSWLLYHWLRATRAKALEALGDRLAAAEDPAAAWRAACPDLDPADASAMQRLDAALAAYAATAAYTPFRVAARPDARATRSALPPAEVHALLLGVRQRWPDASADAGALQRAELSEALREDPAQPLALSALAHLEGRPAAPALRREARGKARRDWRTWLLLGDALDTPAAAAERDAAYRRAAALAPDRARPQVAAAAALLAARRPAEALPFANRAVDLAPWDAEALDALASAVAALGHCPEALVLERRAADRARGAGGEPIRARLAELGRACGAR